MSRRSFPARDKGRVFWLIVVLIALGYLVGAAVTVHQILFLIDHGYNPLDPSRDAKPD